MDRRGRRPPFLLEKYKVWALCRTWLFAVAEEISDLAMAVPVMELQEHDGIGATKENSLWTFMIRSSFTVTMTVSKGSQSDMRRHIEDARHRRRPHEDPVARHESKPFFRPVVINTSRHAACKTHTHTVLWSSPFGLTLS